MTRPTFQDIYTTVFTHLDQQGERAMDKNLICALRNDKGQACAVGCLIPDEHPSLAFKGAVIYMVNEYIELNDMIVPEGNLISYSDRFKAQAHLSGISFLALLQCFHDHANTPERWEDMMNNSLPALGRKYGLEVPERTNKTNKGNGQ